MESLEKMAISPVAVSAYTVANALGLGRDAMLAALRHRRSGLTPCDVEIAPISTYVGRVQGIESIVMPAELRAFDCRNNRLAQVALEQDEFSVAVDRARQQYGPDRIAVVLGTSTSGVLHTEIAYRQRDSNTEALPDWYSYQHSQNMFSVADFARQALSLTGPALVISTACSSSAKVFASAHRLMTAGLCDAAIVGGVDSLCGTTLYGFSSLELVASGPCRPADADRDGISIGEGAGFALLEWPDRAERTAGVALLGYGESSDAFHMSSPHPEGRGAFLAMEQALVRAGCAATSIDYVNLHGTASKINDAVEDRAVSQLFGAAVPTSSTKGWTGHTLGAAGITEAVVALLCVENGFIPGSLNTNTVDPTFASQILLENSFRPVNRVLTNSFGFGGNNCSLVFGRI